MVRLKSMSKHKRSILLSVSSVVLMLISQLTVGQALTLYAEHYPPYAIDAKANEPISSSLIKLQHDKALVGMDIELIQQAYFAMGVEAEFKFRPWKRIMRDVEQGHILGGISCRRTELRETFVNFSAPVSQSRQAFIARESFKSKVPQGIEGLKALKVVIVSGYSQQGMLESRGIKYTSASSLTQGLNLVKRRDQDVFFSGWEGAAYEAKRLGYLDGLVFTRPNIGDVKEFHVCFSKAYTNSDKWRLLLNEGLVKIKEQGLMASIKKKYGIR